MALDWALFMVKLVHVLGAMLWLGFGAYESYLHAPALKRLPARDRIKGFAEAQGRSGPVFGVIGILTLLTGFEAARMLTGSMNPAEWAAAGRPELIWGMGFGLAALVVGVLHVPAVRRLSALAAQPLEESVERQANGVIRRLTMYAHSASLLLLAAVVTMVASNLGGF